MIRKIWILLFVLMTIGVKAQTFTDIKARLTGVSESASNWVDYDNDGDSDILVIGTFYNTNKPIVSTKLYRNDRHNHFTEVPTNIVNVQRGDFDWADYDQDGDKDLFIIGEDNSGKPTANLYRNNLGSTHFTLIKTGIPGLIDGSVEWGDYDRDGDYDLLLTGETKNGPVTKIYRNDRNNKFTDINAPLPGVHFGTAKWADIDEDGDLDLIVSGTLKSGKYITQIFLNNNNKFVPLPTDYPGISLSDIAWADYDLDGDLDFVACGQTQNGSVQTRIYTNDGNGFFSRQLPGLTGVRTGSVDWGDMDHDGDPDLLVTGESAGGPVSIIFRNDRSKGFTNIHANLIGLFTSDGHFGDYDLDGDLDVIISGLSKDYKPITKVYRNDGITRRDTTKARVDYDDQGIFTYNTRVEPMRQRTFYYVYGSCYCDLNGDGKKQYHVFFSPVKKQLVQYQIQERFNKIIRERYPEWPKVDQGEIIENGFYTYPEAEKSKLETIHKYKVSGFVIHELKW
ncbi:MAG: VCBS repeat-containing protein [Bacteroidales bacterium]|nr:VCBS repeat-containing protein [Bacteroidales bacterium]